MMGHGRDVNEGPVKDWAPLAGKLTLDLQEGLNPALQSETLLALPSSSFPPV